MHVKAFGMMTRHPVKAQALPPDLRGEAPVDERGRVASAFARASRGGVPPLRRRARAAACRRQARRHPDAARALRRAEAERLRVPRVGARAARGGGDPGRVPPPRLVRASRRAALVPRGPRDDVRDRRHAGVPARRRAHRADTRTSASTAATTAPGSSAPGSAGERFDYLYGDERARRHGRRRCASSPAAAPTTSTRCSTTTAARRSRKLPNLLGDVAAGRSPRRRPTPRR